MIACCSEGKIVRENNANDITAFRGRQIHRKSILPCEQSLPASPVSGIVSDVPLQTGFQVDISPVILSVVAPGYRGQQIRF